MTAGGGVTLEGDTAVQGVDRSAQLTDYPTNLLNSPPQDLEADFSYSVATPPASPKAEALPPAGSCRTLLLQSSPRQTDATVKPAPPLPSSLAPVRSRSRASDKAVQANKQATPRNRFTELMARPAQLGLGFWFLVTAAFLAAGPGCDARARAGPRKDHRRRVPRRFARQDHGTPSALDVLVTAAHTAGVYLLGAVVLYASKYVIPEQIYPWLSIFSGLVIAVMASTCSCVRAWTGVKRAPDQDADGRDALTLVLEEARRAVPATSDKTVSHSSQLASAWNHRRHHSMPGGIGRSCLARSRCTASAWDSSLSSASASASRSCSSRLALPWSRTHAALAMEERFPMDSALHPDGVLPRQCLIAGLAIAATALPATGISFHWSSLTDGHAGIVRRHRRSWPGAGHAALD